MVLGIVMVAGVVGTCPRNGRAATDEMVAVLRGYNASQAAMNNNKIPRKQVSGRDRGKANRELYSYFTTYELTHGGR